MAGEKNVALNLLDDAGSDKSKQTVLLNKRSDYRMQSQISRFSKEFQRNYEFISKEQETLIKKQKRKLLLPLIQELSSSRREIKSRLASWNKELLAEYRKETRSSSEVPLPPYYTDLKDEVLRARIYNFLYGTNLKVRKKGRSTSKLHLPEIRIDDYSSPAKQNWRKIRDNLGFLIFLEKQQEDREMSEFGYAYNKLRSCRYIRPSRRQLLKYDDYNQSDNNHRCFCNSCILNIIKTNEMSEKRSGNSSYNTPSPVNKGR